MQERRHRPGVVHVAAVVAVVALLGACASAGDAGTDAQRNARPPATPREGGRIVVGTSAEADGFLPAINRWTPSSYMIARAIFDPLAAIDDSGAVQPYLAESFAPNDTYTRWTIKLRPNVTFHDGTPLTSEALVEHFAAAQDSEIAGAAITYFKSMSTPDKQTFVVDLTAPWAQLPILLASQLGFIPAPSMYGDRNAEAATNPIGTGPFKFTNWVIGERLTVDRNASYWRKDNEGRQLPYLSHIEFEPITDDSARSTRLREGNLDVVHTDAYGEVSGFQRMMRDEPDGKLQALLDRSQGAESGVVLNTQSGPFTDRNLRLAAAYAIDRQGIVNQMYSGFYELANGPFTATSKWGAAESFPTFFPERARQLVNDWKAENNGKAPVIRLTNLAVADSVPVAQRIAKSWTDAGFDVKLDNQPEVTGTVALVTGNFDGLLLRFWDRADPDGLFPYFIGDSVKKKGDISLNFPHYADSEVDEALKAARASADDNVRRQQYQRVWDNFAQNLPVVWLFHTRWAVGYQEQVHGIGELMLPTGQRAEPITWGNFFLTGVWVS